MLKISKCIVSIAFAVVVLAGNAQAAVLDVGLNRAELVSLNAPMSEVMIANPEVADIVVHGPQKISVIGKKIGSTNLRFFDDRDNLVREFDVVVGYDLPGIRRTLKKYFPDLAVGVETINNSLAISGVVPDAQTANRVMQLAYEFVKESRRTGEEVEDFTDNDNRFPGIVNLMTLSSGQQVMLKVRIGEVQRSALKNLGISLQNVTNSGNSGFAFGTGGGDRFLDAAIDAADRPFGTFDGLFERGSQFFTGGATLTSGSVSLSAMLEALERDGIFKLLSEPNLTAVSGETASFLAGGEFPIVTIDEDGNRDVEFKKFGVTLSFTPYVLTKNRIRMTVAPELSEINLTAEAGSNSGIPALTTRKASTTVELSPGESFMIAGLIRDQINATVDEVPGIAEVPIISSLFRSTSYRRGETEMVISVTPYLVDPIVNSEIRLPSDDFRSPSTMEMFFYGALGSMNGNATTIGETPFLEGPVGYMVD